MTFSVCEFRGLIKQAFPSVLNHCDHTPNYNSVAAFYGKDGRAERNSLILGPRTDFRARNKWKIEIKKLIWLSADTAFHKIYF